MPGTAGEKYLRHAPGAEPTSAAPVPRTATVTVDRWRRKTDQPTNQPPTAAAAAAVVDDVDDDSRVDVPVVLFVRQLWAAVMSGTASIKFQFRLGFRAGERMNCMFRVIVSKWLHSLANKMHREQ